MLDNLYLFLSIAQSDWSFDQYSLSLDSEYNTTNNLKSSWLDTVLNKGNGSSNNSGGDSPNNNGGGSPNNNGGGSPNNNGGGNSNNNGGDNSNNNGGSSQSETVINTTSLADYLANNRSSPVQLRDIGISFRSPNSEGINSEMSRIAIAIRKQDSNYAVFYRHNPAGTWVTEELVNKVRNFQRPL